MNKNKKNKFRKIDTLSNLRGLDNLFDMKLQKIEINELVNAIIIYKKEKEEESKGRMIDYFSKNHLINILDKEKM